MLIAFLVWILILITGFVVFGVLYRLKLIEKYTSSSKDNLKKYLLKLANEELEELNDFILVDQNNIFKYETLNSDSYVSRLFVMGRGSWRATQGNVFTSNMLAKEMEDEFSKSL
ncbi:hypothetical protein [Ruminococcus sp.]